MKRLVTTVLVACVCTMSMVASASLLDGDAVTVTFEPNIITLNGNIGAGIELGLGVFAFDLNSGPGGDVLNWTASGDGNLDNITGITIESLEFTDASSLIGFNLFSTVLPNLEFTLTATSIAFTFDPIFSAGPGTVLRGQFITPTTTVAEPGLLGLLVVGLVGMGLRRRRELGNEASP